MFSVIAGEDDLMVRLMEFAFYTEVEHKGGARKAHALQACRGVLSECFGFEEVSYGVAEIRVEHEVIRGYSFPFFELNSDGTSVSEENPADGLLKVEGCAVFSSQFGHEIGNPAKASDWVFDAEGVLDIGDHGKDAGAFPGGHTEVFGLKRKSEGEVFIAEAAIGHVKEASAECKVRDCKKKVGVEKGREAMVGFLQAGIEAAETGCFPFHKRGVTVFPTGENPCDLGGHGVGVRVDVEVLVLKYEAVHGVKGAAGECGRIAAGLPNDFLENPFEHEKGRADIETVGAEREFSVASADPVLRFEHRHSKTAMREDHCGGQSSGTCTDYDNMLGTGHEGFLSSLNFRPYPVLAGGVGEPVELTLDVHEEGAKPFFCRAH